MNTNLDNMQVIASKFNKTITNAAIGLTNVAIGFTTDEVAHARAAFISVETDDLRWTPDGTTPTAAIGHLIKKDDSGWIQGRKQMANLKFIRVTADVKFNITLYK